MKKGLWWFFGLAAVLAVLAVAGNKLGWYGNDHRTEVETARTKKASITEKVSASGKVQPEVEIKISADVSGEIIELTVKEGDSVRKGDLLFRIRPDNYQSLLDRARASLNSAKANYAQMKAGLAQTQARFVRTRLEFERSKKLYAQKVISEADWEGSRSAYEVGENEIEAAKSNLEAAVFGIQNAEANVKDATENLRKTTVFAPMSGIVSRLNVEQGERVVGTAQMSGTEVLRLANLRDMEVEVEVNENDIVRIQMGDSAEIEVDSYSYLRRKFKGVVTSIANSAVETATAETVTEFKVHVRIDPASYRDLIGREGSRYPFRPGMTASLEIKTDFREKVLAVPLSAVVSRSAKDMEGEEDNSLEEKKDKSEMSSEEKRRQEAAEEKLEVVFVLADGKVEIRKVKTGIADFEQVEILTGLREGETVVTGPFSALTKTLQDGDEVRLREKKTKKEKGASGKG
jgi:HlyD family secretion protein